MRVWTIQLNSYCRLKKNWILIFTDKIKIKNTLNNANIICILLKSRYVLKKIKKLKYNFNICLQISNYMCLDLTLNSNSKNCKKKALGKKKYKVSFIFWVNGIILWRQNRTTIIPTFKKNLTLICWGFILGPNLTFFND